MCLTIETKIPRFKQPQRVNGMRIQSIVDHTRGTSAVFALMIVPLVQIFSIRYSPVILGVAIIVSVTASFTSYYYKLEAASFPRVDKTLLAVILCVLIWAILSLSWGLDPGRGILKIFAAVVCSIGGWYLGYQFSKIPFERLPIVYLLGIVSTIFAINAGLNYTVDIATLTGAEFHKYDYNRIAVGLSLLVWPLALILSRNITYLALSMLLFAGAVVTIFVSESETAKFSLICGLCAATVGCVVPVLRKPIYWVMGVFVLTMPILPPVIERTLGFLPASFTSAAHSNHRLQIWKGASDIIIENWLFGWGMMSDRVLGNSGAMGKYAQNSGFSAIILSPHNLALELWINIGLVGMLPISAIFIFLSFRKVRSNYHSFASLGLLVTAVTALLVGAGSSGFQGWLLAILTISAATYTSLATKTEHLHQGDQ